jgi:hypothetical protein
MWHLSGLCHVGCARMAGHRNKRCFVGVLGEIARGLVFWPRVLPLLCAVVPASSCSLIVPLHYQLLRYAIPALANLQGATAKTPRYWLILTCSSSTKFKFLTTMEVNLNFMHSCYKLLLSPMLNIVIIIYWLKTLIVAAKVRNQHGWSIKWSTSKSHELPKFFAPQTRAMGGRMWPSLSNNNQNACFLKFTQIYT